MLRGLRHVACSFLPWEERSMSHQNRDVVVVGASAGGVQALSRLTEALPEDLPATVLIALHVAPRPSRTLHLVICGKGKLNCAQARTGDALGHGKVYVAPPDHHLRLVGANAHVRIQVDRGPRENLSRPSIDALFRSAAACCGARVVGVLMTGYLDDGVAGSGAVRRSGGKVVVQDPGDAEVPDLPLNALKAGTADLSVPLEAMAAAIVTLVNERASPIEQRAPAELRSEAALAARAGDLWPEIDTIGERAPLGCPRCGGAMWVLDRGKVDEHFRCHVGHAFSSDALLSDQDVEIERALHSAVRILEEKARFLMRMASSHATDHHLGARYRQDAARAEADASTLRDVLLGTRRKSA
jgi:two-component system chemotaxis response regulator CheB